jgi:ferredoxin-NADP reductase
MYALSETPLFAHMWQVLIKRGNPVSEALIAHAVPGACVRVTLCEGYGFDVRGVGQNTDVLVLSMGTGFASVKTVWEHVLREVPLAGRKVWYHGVRAREEVPFVGFLKQCEQAHVRVRLCESGEKGVYVQHQAHAESWGGCDFSRTQVFVCGSASMEQEAVQMLIKSGLSEERIHRNHG